MSVVFHVTLLNILSFEPYYMYGFFWGGGVELLSDFLTSQFNN